MTTSAFMTTGFGPESAILLNMLSSSMPVYHLRESTRDPQWKKEIIRRFPHLMFTEVPVVQDDKKATLTWLMGRMQPNRIWFTGIRAAHSTERGMMDQYHRINEWNCLRIAPLFYWNDAACEDYAAEHDLPFEPRNPKKTECNLHEL